MQNTPSPSADAHIPAQDESAEHPTIPGMTIFAIHQDIMNVAGVIGIVFPLSPQEPITMYVDDKRIDETQTLVTQLLAGHKIPSENVVYKGKPPPEEHPLLKGWVRGTFIAPAHQPEQIASQAVQSDEKQRMPEAS